MRIVIDPGHRNSVFDFGATASGVKESALALEISKHVAEGFKRAGHDVFFTRESEQDVISLSARTRKANALEKIDWYISMHINSFSQTSEGFEVFHYGDQEEVCQNICTSVCLRTGQKNRGAKVGDFHVLRETACKAILVECGFLSNPGERSNLQEEGFQLKIAEGILEGFGIVNNSVAIVDDNSIEILLNGVIKRVDTINKDGFNYIKMRDLADNNIEIDYDAILKMPILRVK